MWKSWSKKSRDVLCNKQIKKSQNYRTFLEFKLSKLTQKSGMGYQKRLNNQKGWESDRFYMRFASIGCFWTNPNFWMSWESARMVSSFQLIHSHVFVAFKFLDFIISANLKENLRFLGEGNKKGKTNGENAVASCQIILCDLRDVQRARSHWEPTEQTER